MRRLMALAALILALVGCSSAPPPSPTPPPPPAPARTFRLADSGFYGNLYLPADATSRARAVLLIGGSEGGMSSVDEAEALTHQGFAVMTVAYFKEPQEPRLPATPADIPIEYFATAARVLAAQPEVDPAHIAVWGGSRGSEAAALLAADFPTLVHGAVLESPSSVVNPGYPVSSKPAWTLGGQPLPAVRTEDFGRADPPDAQDALLPVEKISGPVVTICGGSDTLWPSCAYSAVIAQRAGGGRVTSLSYPDAGHVLAVIAAEVARGYHLDAPFEGGTEDADVKAGDDALARAGAILKAA